MIQNYCTCQFLQSWIRGFKANAKFLSSFEVSSERFYFPLSSLLMELFQRWSSDKLKTSLNLKIWHLVTHYTFIWNFNFEFLEILISIFSRTCTFRLKTLRKMFAALLRVWLKILEKHALPGARRFCIREAL